jgi:hypothetical protein
LPPDRGLVTSLTVIPAIFANYDDPARAADIYHRIVAGWTIGATPILAVRGVGISPVKNLVTGCTDYNGLMGAENTGQDR